VVQPFLRGRADPRAPGAAQHGPAPMRARVRDGPYDQAVRVVLVPDFVGLSVDDARAVATSAHLVLTSGRPDGPPLAALTWPGHWVVTWQRPSAGESVPSRSWVVIDFAGRGGNAGDREPRAPTPSTGSTSAEAGEPTGGR
jgi:hypothetical protein